MERLIDDTFMWGDLKIASLVQQSSLPVNGTTTNSKADEFFRFVDKYQKKYITQFFGAEVALLTTLPTELKSILIDEDVKVSPLANYIYFYYMKANYTATTNIGQKVQTTPNTIATTPHDKMVDAWNEMVDMNNIVLYQLDLMKSSGTVYPDFDITLINPDLTLDMFIEINKYNI